MKSTKIKIYAGAFIIAIGMTFGVLNNVNAEDPSPSGKYQHFDYKCNPLSMKMRKNCTDYHTAELCHTDCPEPELEPII